jgi:hypothetical protein
MRSTGSIWWVMVACVVACGGPDVRADVPSGRVVDSILPREEALRRFRQDLPPVDSLRGGAASRDALVAELLAALGRSDTATLARLAISRSEFAYLYYPTAAEGKPPYDLEPGLMWFMQFERSNQSIRTVLQRLSGQRMTLVDYACGKGEVREGENVIVGPCLVRWRNEAGDTITGRLFSRILERGGRFKVLGYADDSD